MPLSAAQILRPVLYAPPSMPALDLLLKMQASRTHMALVIDEYGGTDGLVSIEDVVEAIVGDIEDEHDEAETPELHAVQRRRLHRRGARAPRRRFRRGRLRFLLAPGRRGGRHDRRAGHRRGRTRAEPRRSSTRPGRIRIRGARRRPAPHQAAENRASRRPRRVARAPARPRCEPERSGVAPGWAGSLTLVGSFKEGSEKSWPVQDAKAGSARCWICASRRGRS